MRKQISVIQEMEAIQGGPGMTWADTSWPLQKNGYIDVYKDAEDADSRIFFCKRPGLGTNSQFTPSPSPVVNSLATCGALAPDGTRNFFIVYTDGTLANTVFYYNNAVTAKPGGWALSGVTGAGSGSHDIIPLASTSTASSYGGYYWALTSYNSGAVINSAGAVTQIVAAAYTAWTKKTNILAMDGYLFQADTDSGYIYNSDLNTPTSWTATSRILAASHPGIIMRLMRVRNYLVAFKTSSLEFFRNDGNPTPGSPLSAEPQLTQRFGCSAPHLIVEASDGIVFAGFDPSGVPGVFKLHYNTLTVERISNSWMSQALEYGLGFNGVTGAPYHVSDARPATYWRSLLLYFRDKEMITMPLPIFSGTATYVYDNQLKTWGIWSAYNPWTTFEDGFPSYCTIRRAVGPSGSAVTLVANASDYNFSALDTNNAGDYSHAIDYKWVSSYMDFGTSRRKFMGSLTVDVTSHSSSTVNSVVNFFYRDADVTNIVSTTRSVTWTTLAQNASKRIRFPRLGSFVSRQFVIGVNDAVSFIRISGLEADIDMEEDDIS